MTDTTRVFILGAGFSKPAGMPLATEVLPLLVEELQFDEMRTWLHGLRERLAWLSASEGQTDSFALNIEQVFHYAHFDVELHRLRQQLAPVGRADGPETPWKQGESVEAWLSFLEEARQHCRDQERRGRRCRNVCAHGREPAPECRADESIRTFDA